MDSWAEIVQCKEESRRELVLKGNQDFKDKVKKLNGELPLSLYELELLNFLECSSLDIEELHENVGNLENLTQLFLMHNKISRLPDTLCKLSVLKFLDLSGNSLTSLPEDIGNLTKLHTLNLAFNKLQEIPESFFKLEDLAVLNLAHNDLSQFPLMLYEEPVCVRLADLNASHNNIDDIHDAVEKMTMLKNIDFSNNKISEITQALGKCLKLKVTSFKGNPLKDKRLKKLIEQNNSQKAILDYVRTKGRKIAANEGASVKGTRKNLKDQKVKEAAEKQENDLAKYFLRVLKCDDNSEVSNPFRVIASEEVKDVRPFVVGCLIKSLVLDSDKQFKSFITLQTKLHEDICQKRTIATIATHDAKFIPDSVVHYSAADPSKFSIRPLGRQSEVKALAYYKRLCKEADDVRKEKKRNQVTGVHKYLSLLKDKNQFACLRRSDNCVISLPPLTNSDVTKISQCTCDIFVEVTGTKSLNVCKSILDELLKRMAELGFYSKLPKGSDFYDDSSDEEKLEKEPKLLVVQQVRVENDQGDVKVIYPSRTDLTFDSKEVKVERA